MIEIKDDYLAALTDNEIADELLKKETEQKIESDDDFAFDYKIQLFVKHLIKEKVIKYETPVKVRKKIIKQTISRASANN